MNPFYEKIYAKLRQVPKGKVTILQVTTYKFQGMLKYSIP